MIYREISQGTFVPWNGEPINNISYPLNISTLWTDSQLATLKLYKVHDPEPLPEGKWEIGRTVKRVDGVVRWVRELVDAEVPLTPLKPVNFKLGMLTLNVTPDQVDEVIAQMPEPDRMIAKIYWTSAREFRRDDPLIAQVAAAFGKTDADIDEAWRYAVALGD